MESIADSRRGDELMNRHRVGHHFYLQSLYELLLLEFVASSHCPMVLRTPISMESIADSQCGDGLMYRHRVGHYFYVQSLIELVLFVGVCCGRVSVRFPLVSHVKPTLIIISDLETRFLSVTGRWLPPRS